MALLILTIVALYSAAYGLVCIGASSAWASSVVVVMLIFGGYRPTLESKYSLTMPTIILGVLAVMTWARWYLFAVVFPPEILAILVSAFSDMSFAPLLVLTVPVAEEILFRGALWDALIKSGRPVWSTWLCVTASFGIAHYVPGAHPLLSWVLPTILGGVCGFLRYRYGLYPAIAMHMAYNASGILLIRGMG